MNPDVAKLDELANAPLNGDRLASSEEVETGGLADLLEEIALLIRRYIQLPAPDLALVIACWITLTYLYQRVQYCGYLALRSATPRCGKSRLLRLIALLARGEPPITTMPTAATLFRTTREVLILDEVDRLRNADRDTFGDVLAVLNAGFEHGATVERVEKVRLPPIPQLPPFLDVNTCGQTPHTTMLGMTRPYWSHQRSTSGIRLTVDSR